MSAGGAPGRGPAGIPGRLARAYRRLTRQERVAGLDRRVRDLEEAVAETLAVNQRLERELREVERVVVDVADPGRPGEDG